MISLSGTPRSVGSEKASIYFEHKDKRKTKRNVTLPLLYGAKCPTCMNVILASFFVDKPIDLYPYEETAVLFTRTLEKNGTFSHTFPKADDPIGTTAYESVIEEYEGKKIQTIRLINHIIPISQANKRGFHARMETGERTCVMCGAASLSYKQAIKSALAIAGQPLNDINNFAYGEETKELHMSGGKGLNTQGFREIDTYGEIPVHVILVPKDKVEGCIYYWPGSTAMRKK